MSIKAFCPTWFKSSGGRGLFCFLIAFLFFFLPPIATSASDTVSPPSKVNSFSATKEPRGIVPFNQRILSRLWDKGYLEEVISQEIPAIPLSERKAVGDLEFRLNKVNRNIRHIERFFYHHQFWVEALLRELEETGIWDYLFHLSSKEVGNVYRFRQVARALVQAATWSYPDQKSRLTLIRLFAYVGEYLTFVYEQHIYQARLSLGKDPDWAEQLTYTEWISRSFTAQLEGVKLELLEPQGSYMRAYGHPSLDFVVKVAQQGVNPELKRTVDFELDIEPKVILARAHLAGLAANTLVLEDVSVSLGGQVRTFAHALIQTRVIPLRHYFRSLKEKTSAKMEEIVEQWIQLQRRMWQRGIVDQDIKITDNYGYDLYLDRVVIFDLTHISDQKEDVYWKEYYENIFDLFRVANSSFLADQHPSLGGKYLLNMYGLQDFEKFWQEDYRMGEEEFQRYALSDPGGVTDFFQRTFEEIMGKHKYVGGALNAIATSIATETMGIHELRSYPGHPLVSIFGNPANDYSAGKGNISEMEQGHQQRLQQAL